MEGVVQQPSTKQYSGLIIIIYCLFSLPLIIIINILFERRMSYGYSLYSSFSAYPQTVYPLYIQTTCENTLPSFYFVNTMPSLFQLSNPQKIDPIILSKPTTPQTNILPEPKLPRKCESKQIKKLGKSKDQNFGWRNQNKERNVISSILKGYVQHVLQGRGMIKLIEELAKKRQLSNGVSNFYEFMSCKFPSKKSYVGIRYIQQTLTPRPCDNPMTFIMSITLRRYLKQVYPLEIIESCKTKKKTRLALLKKARSIGSILFTE